MTVVMKKCPYCNEPAIIEVDADRYHKWIQGRVTGAPSSTHSIQAIFPDLMADEREVMISGTHPECWNKMFGED